MAVVSGCFYRPQTKLREGNVFTPVCDSVHRGGCVSQHAMGVGFPACITGRMTGGCLHQGVLCRPPQSDTTGYGQRAGGTHPSGMHSCL